jgi:hypothetical protein
VRTLGDNPTRHHLTRSRSTGTDQIGQSYAPVSIANHPKIREMSDPNIQFRHAIQMAD